MDLDSTANILMRKAISEMTSTTIATAVEHLTNLMSNVLGQYRTHCASNGALNHLILPETLRLLPLYINSFLKKHVLRKEKATASDLRVASAFQICYSSLYTVATLLYPKLYWLSPYLADEESQVGCEIEGGYIVLPNSQALLIATLEDTGLYLLDNGETLYIIVFSECKIVGEVFGVASVDEVADLEELPLLDSSANLKLHAICNQLRSNKSESFQDIRIITERNFPIEAFFQEVLIEEDHGGVDGYGNFLAYLHRMIQNK